MIMVEPNELKCVNCKTVLEDPEIFVKTYGEDFICPKCNNPLTKV